MENCIFCSIAKKDSPTNIEYEDNDIIAFYDINPKAPVHILIIPKKHITAVSTLKDADTPLIGKMILIAKNLAEKEDIAKSGYRLVFNSGPQSGQLVEHIHLHLLGGKKLDSMV